MRKALFYGVVGVLVLGLVAGTAYFLLRPTEAQAGRGSSSSQGQNRGGGEGVQGSGNGSGNGQANSERALGSAQDDALSAEEVAGILYMREEEKLARDVYSTLYEQWGTPIFQNIAESEQAHMDAVETLINRYGLDDPVAGRDVGEFTDPTLQSLYAELVAQGSQSLADALRVGATIEEIDILDLEKHVAQTDVRAIQRVYENLTKGSRNHLRAFVGTLEQRTGETYEPQYLDPEAYAEIVNAATEGGGYGREGSLASGGGGNRGVGNDASGGGNGSGGGASDGRGQGSGKGQGSNGTVKTVEWETLTGTVTAVDGEVTVKTAGGEVLVGMGQAAYWEGFVLEVGNQVSVVGFFEDGEFKAQTVENLTLGGTIVLRDSSGRPMWAGGGKLQNQGSAGN